jgi:hypothetical protein
MDFPKLSFGPAGNIKNASGFLVDLDDIFDGKCIYIYI